MLAYWLFLLIWFLFGIESRDCSGDFAKQNLGSFDFKGIFFSQFGLCLVYILSHIKSYSYVQSKI